ncbi:MAG: hypothetical protein GTO45_41055 [Candidatus Aminicenantes bacterium]|nr:hypothetical protein [Candidatus Aminicenantes bacterium]NIM84994.1 hypothetical protein [Candidatus Aminicenantes bacterium]NIN24508.1 hypothetical protein [Candidatus Aminicenantes bacterium]NIN48272.1 hypothetical protein [Candidatus Aminicenantes bacterium]NIN91175.1 hypothetical protein [Candidatus Aminicenantes bacterium]
MAEIKKINENMVIDYMARDYDSLLLSMRSLIENKLPEWKEYESEADFGNVLLQLFAHMGDILSYYQDRIANESFLGTAQERRSIIHHLRLIGYRLATAAPASTTLELTVAEDCTKTVVIKKGDAFATKSRKDKPSVRFEYTGDNDLVINFDAITAVGGVRKFSGIPVEEGRLIKDEIIGVSDGKPNQRFPLAHPRLILRSMGLGSNINKDIILVTQLGSQIKTWTQRESLAFSQDDQEDFAVEIDEQDRAFILLGDGVFGAVPKADTVIKATYRVGGGSHGNVSANSIETIVDAPDLVLLPPKKITNPRAASGGADRETIEHAVKHAPGVFRSQKRAVTAGDYVDLALDFKGVGKVRAEKGDWNKVVLFVAPAGGGQVSDVLKKNLLAYFEDKRPVSTIVEIRDVDYVKIYVAAKVGIESYYSWEDIEEKVKQAAGNHLAFDNVDFGHTLYLSKFYEAIEDIEGVAFVTIEEFWRDGAEPEDKPIARDGKIKLKENEIPMIPPAEEDSDYSGGILVKQYISSE